MIYQERLFKILRFAHVSEKSNLTLENSNTFVFRVLKCATKSDIKNAVRMLFLVKVHRVNIVIVAGKKKGSVNNRGIRSDWKKAYVVLKEGEKINSLTGLMKTIE